MAVDKRTLIYEATLSLVYENSDLSSIKVASIAARANIGKGTVYEYFESKEQVIGEALIYMMNNNINALEVLIDQDLDFKTTYLRMLDSLSSMLGHKRSVYNLISLNTENLVVHTTIQKILATKLEELRQAYFRNVERMVEKSVQEGILKVMPAKFDWQTAVLTSITFVFFHRQFEDEFDSMDDGEVLEKAYNAYVKLLSR